MTPTKHTEATALLASMRNIQSPIEGGFATFTCMYRNLQGNLNSSGLQFKVAYWPALALSSAAQLPPPISSGSKYLHLLVFNLLTAAAGKVRSAFCEAVTITQTFSQEHNAHAPVISY